MNHRLTALHFRTRPLTSLPFSDFKIRWRLSIGLALLFALTAPFELMAAPKLKVSENKRFLIYDDGRPFFYLGDTAWELFHRLNREEAEKYLKDRAKKGFTVIQAVVLAELDGLNTPNAYGHQPLVENDLARPHEDYFKHVDYIVNKAEALGMFIGMLPTWGDKWNKGGWGAGPQLFTPDNAAAYGEWLGRRYASEPIIWILGGDRSITNDTNGRPNLISLASTQGAIALGNATDTSNFLSAANLLASPLGASRVSTNSIARLSLSAKLDATTFQGGPPTAGAHSLTINGTTINYNAASDSLTDIINRITSSPAGVTARYDPISDTIKLQQAKTGSLQITAADDGVGGDLLAKLGLIAGTQTLGVSAQYKIDGGATQSAATNTVTTGTGVSLTLNALTGPGTPATVTVAPSQPSMCPPDCVRSSICIYDGKT